MKSKVAILSLVSLLFTLAASAQGIENDDMYFNAKDRAKLNTAKATEVSASIKKSKKATVADEAVNPTDSYSARNVNPEYEARTNSQTAQADNQDYFVNNYKYNNASNFDNWNNNFNNWYSNPWYGGNYYDPYINSFNTPYYGSRYDTWGNPWCNPYYRSGWSSSFSYHWGSGYNYGWGMNFGYGNYGYNPYNSWAAWSYPYYGSAWGPAYYGGGYGYPTQVIIVESGYRGPVYGKRASRSTHLSGDNERAARSYNRQVVETSPNVRPAIGGRTSSSVNSQSDYYNRGWRNQTQQNSSSSYTRPSYSDPNSSGTSNNRSSWESNTRSSWNESNSGNSSRSYDTGRSSSGSSGGNSGGSSSGSSSTGSRSSGRGN